MANRTKSRTRAKTPRLRRQGGARAKPGAAAHLRETELLLAISSTIAAVTGQVASCLDVDRVLDLVASKACQLLGADGSAFWRYEDQRGGFRVFRAFQLDAEQTRQLDTLGHGLAGRVVAERRPVWIPDVLADPERNVGPRPAEVPDRRRLRAALGAPMLSRQNVDGVLVVYHHEPHEFSLREVQLLATLANQAAIAIENARLDAEAQRQRAQVVQILESTSDGIVLLALDGSVRSTNRRAAELFGLPENRTGLTLDELLIRDFPDPAHHQRAVNVFRALLDDPGRGGEGELELSTQRAVLHWVAQPTVDAGGGTVGLTVTFQDLTREREVSRMKSDFVSFVTHQLRTPLAGIRWMLELATQQGTSTEESAAYLRDAGDSALRLTALVNDLLDAARLESRTLTIDPRQVALRTLTDRVVAELTPLVQEKGHRVVTDAPGDPAVLADPQMLRQVLTNLVSNAIKYTPRGGEIVIDLAPRDGVVRWAIRDNGVGIPRAAQARLFEKFYRAENVRAIETDGTGLGLYMVRLILERLGGRVWCNSEEGHGSCFTFELPAVEVPSDRT
jgi:signal transduction histidine kinase